MATRNGGNKYFIERLKTKEYEVKEIETAINFVFMLIYTGGLSLTRK